MGSPPGVRGDAEHTDRCSGLSHLTTRSEEPSLTPRKVEVQDQKKFSWAKLIRSSLCQLMSTTEAGYHWYFQLQESVSWLPLRDTEEILAGQTVSASVAVVVHNQLERNPLIRENGSS